MQQEGSFRITKDGYAMFGLNRGDEYIVITMDGYTAQPGDTFSGIAVRHGVSLQKLQEANPQITDIDRIGIGQQVNIPKSGV